MTIYYVALGLKVKVSLVAVNLEKRKRLYFLARNPKYCITSTKGHVWVVEGPGGNLYSLSLPSVPLRFVVDPDFLKEEMVGNGRKRPPQHCTMYKGLTT